MPRRPIVQHAGSFRGTAPPVLPFLAPRAFEQRTPAERLRRWTTADVAANDQRHHTRDVRAGSTSRDVAGRSRVRDSAVHVPVAVNSSPALCPLLQTRRVHHDAPRTRRFQDGTSSKASLMLSCSAALTRPRLSPQYSGIWAFFNRQARRAYSTADEDYLVEEDEEKAILDGEPEFPFHLTQEQLFSLNNPRFRALRRAAFMLSTHEHVSTPQIEELLEKADKFPPLDSFPQQDVWWIKKFAQLNAVYDVRLPPALRKSQLEVNASTEHVVQHLLSHGRDEKSIKTTWILEIRETLSKVGKRNIWCEMMLWLLRHDPDAVLPVLRATGRGWKSPSYAIADILEHFISYTVQDSKARYLPVDLFATLASLLAQNPFLGRALSQKFVHQTLGQCTLEEALCFLRLLRDHGFRPSWHTFYHIAYYFGGHGEYPKALSALQKSVELGAPPTSKLFLEICSTILRCSATNAGAYHASSQILSKFTEMGVTLNIYLYTVVMHNAVDAGDIETALQIFDILESRGVKANDYTYTVLIKGLKHSESSGALRSVLKHAGQALPELERPHIVATDILHCVYLKHFAPEGTDQTFADLAQTYHEYFDARPLIAMGVPAHYFGARGDSPQKINMNTTPPPIGIILAAYLELVSKANPEEVVHLYRRFRHLTEESGHPFFNALKDSNYYYNAFLLGLAQNASTLNLMPEVLRVMTDKRIHERPLPTEHTWDILVNGFMRHKQVDAAQRVLETMRAHGQEPNDVTWNSLVKGYARVQDLDGVLETIRSMELKKVELSRFSIHLLGRMRDKEKLAKGMREIEAEKQRQAEEEQEYLVPEDYQEDDTVEPADREQGAEDMEERIKKEFREDWNDDGSIFGGIENAASRTDEHRG